MTNVSGQDKTVWRITALLTRIEQPLDTSPADPVLAM